MFTCGVAACCDWLLDVEDRVGLFSTSLVTHRQSGRKTRVGLVHRLGGDPKCLKYSEGLTWRLAVGARGQCVCVCTD